MFTLPLLPPLVFIKYLPNSLRNFRLTRAFWNYVFFFGLLLMELCYFPLMDYTIAPKLVHLAWDSYNLRGTTHRFSLIKNAALQPQDGDGADDDAAELTLFPEKTAKPDNALKVHNVAKRG